MKHCNIVVISLTQYFISCLFKPSNPRRAQSTLIGQLICGLILHVLKLDFGLCNHRPFYNRKAEYGLK